MVSLRMTKDEWILRQCEMSGITREQFDEMPFVVKECVCTTVSCPGWYLEMKEPKGKTNHKVGG